MRRSIPSREEEDEEEEKEDSNRVTAPRPRGEPMLCDSMPPLPVCRLQRKVACVQCSAVRYGAVRFGLNISALVCMGDVSPGPSHWNSNRGDPSARYIQTLPTDCILAPRVCDVPMAVRTP